MEHKLKISLSKEPKIDGMVACKSMTVKQRFLKKLGLDGERVAVIVPGDDVKIVTFDISDDAASSMPPKVERRSANAK